MSFQYPQVWSEDSLGLAIGVIVVATWAWIWVCPRVQSSQSSRSDDVRIRSPEVKAPSPEVKATIPEVKTPSQEAEIASREVKTPCPAVESLGTDLSDVQEELCRLQLHLSHRGRAKDTLYEHLGMSACEAFFFLRLGGPGGKLEKECLERIEFLRDQSYDAAFDAVWDFMWMDQKTRGNLDALMRSVGDTHVDDLMVNQISRVLLDPNKRSYYNETFLPAITRGGDAVLKDMCKGTRWESLSEHILA